MWYYAINKEIHGPISKAELFVKLQMGELKESTLVWTSGHRNWHPASDMPELFQQEAPPPVRENAERTSEFPPISKTLLPKAAPQLSTCAYCGLSFTASMHMNYNGKNCCPVCALRFLSNANSGTTLRQVRIPSSMHCRFGAFFIDQAILMLVGFIFVPLFYTGHLQWDSLDLTDLNVVCKALALPLYSLLNTGVFLIYDSLFTYQLGATPGKLAMKIAVIDLNTDAPPTFRKAICRSLAKILSYILCFMGFFMAYFSRERKTLHDLLCATLVYDNSDKQKEN